MICATLYNEKVIAVQTTSEVLCFISLVFLIFFNVLRRSSNVSIIEPVVKALFYQ